MPTLEDIKSQIKQLDGFSQFLGKKEIKELPNILWEDELLENIVQGFYSGGNGILVASNKRLIFVDKGMMWGLKVEDFPYDKISSIQYETGLVFGTIIIFTSGNRAKIENVDKAQCRNFCDYVRARISGVKAHAGAQTQKSTEPISNTNNSDFIEQIERLSVLRAQGVLSNEEFDQAKKKLLGL